MEEISNEGESKNYTYDAVGNVTSVTDRERNTIKYEYSLTGQIVRVTDALGNKAEYTYDENDRLTGILQNGNSLKEQTRRTQYKRNLLGQVECTVDALGHEERYQYNKRGELIEKLDKDGFLTCYSYTRQGDVGCIRYADGREVKLSYNSLRQLEEIKDWLGVTRIQNDALGRAEKISYPDGKEVHYTYGKMGERQSITYPDGQAVYYSYDGNLRLSKLQAEDKVITYSYDRIGRLAKKYFTNGIETAYTYNQKGQISTLIHIDSEGVLDQYLYQYDRNGNRTEIEKKRRGKEESGKFSYRYDSIGRLKEVAKDGYILREYEYDAFGNRTMLRENGQETTYGYNALNQLISRKSFNSESEYQYDRRGNLTNHIENGQVKYRYLYGALNRLEKAENNKGGCAEYLYNGLGHRVEKKVWENNHTVQAPMSKINYVIDLTRQYHNLLEKEEGSNNQTYIWDGNVAGLLDEKGSSYVYLQDELGSPIRLIDGTGKVAETYEYDEFGQEVYGIQESIQPFGYTGYQKDCVAETYYAQAREYQPDVGRFISKDKDKFIRKRNIKTLNQYNYCELNPMINIDPMGFDLEDHYSPQPRKNDPIQVRVRGNTVTIDAYVDIKGDTETEIEDVTAHDLVIEGIEGWGGNYDNVFGHNTELIVNVHEGHKPWYWWLPWVSNQNYLPINLHNGSGRAGNTHSVPWNRRTPGYIDMFTHFSSGGERSVLDYRNTITHEMGHVFGMDDGYEDDNFGNDNTLRPLADMLSEDDIMVNNHLEEAFVSNFDIQMLIIAAELGEWQYYMSYSGNIQSLGAVLYEECND